MCRNITELRGLEPPATREEIEAALVDVIEQLGSRHDPLRVVHQVGEQPVLLRREADGLAGQRDLAAMRVEAQRAAGDLG